MRNYFIIILTLLFSCVTSFAQTDGGIAHVGPLGVYIISGNKLASESHPSGDITGYRIERKQTGESDWKVIAEQSTPETRGDLERALVEAFNYISYHLSSENISIEKH